MGVSELTQGVGFTCCVIIPWMVIAFSWASFSSLASVMSKQMIFGPVKGELLQCGLV